MYIPGALHGIEGSYLADSGLRKLRSYVFRAVWSRGQPLANVGAVLSLPDGPQGCDPAYCVVWHWFRLVWRYLAHHPSQVERVHRLVDMVTEGCTGHGQVHLLVESSSEVGFRWDSGVFGWARPRLLVLTNLAGPIQHFKTAILNAWRDKVATDLCARGGFRGRGLLEIAGTL